MSSAGIEQSPRFNEGSAEHGFTTGLESQSTAGPNSETNSDGERQPILEEEGTSAFSFTTGLVFQNTAGPNSESNSDSERQPLLEKQVSCKVCRKSFEIESFADIKPGDHIRLPMKYPCMHHHAIVEEIQLEDAHNAKLKVIDIPSKVKEHALCFCSRKPLTIKSHWYNDAEKKEDAKIVNCRTIKRIDYKKRGLSQQETLKRAQLPAGETEKEIKAKHYCLCICNCEHFAAAMVIGKKGSDEKIESLMEKATSLQAERCGWLFFHVVLAVAQFIFYYFNFYLYAVYAQQDESYNHFFGNSSRNALKWCYTGSSTWGIQTRCDWICFGIVLAFYVFVYLLQFVRLCKGCPCRCLKEQAYVCTQCKVSARVVFLAKGISFVIFEILMIFLEKYIYKFIECMDTHPIGTLIIIFIISLIEFALVFFLVPGVFVNRLIYHYPRSCIGRCCKKICCCNNSKRCKFWCCCPFDFDFDSHEYVKHFA